VPALTFDLIIRTPSSARWAILHDQTQVGSVDMHLEQQRARATIVVAASLDDDALDEIIEAFDAQMIPDEFRRDVRLTVWRGESLGTFAPAG